MLCKLCTAGSRFPQTRLMRTSLSEILKGGNAFALIHFRFLINLCCLPSRKLYPLIRNYPEGLSGLPCLFSEGRMELGREGKGLLVWRGSWSSWAEKRMGPGPLEECVQTTRGPDQRGAAASRRRQSRPSHTAMVGSGVEARGRTRQLGGSRSEPATSWETWKGTWRTGPSWWGEDERCKRERE